MANPNIVNVSAIYGKTTSLTPSNTSATVLIANAASSGKVVKINNIIAANIDGAGAYDATVAINSAADGSGTSYAIASTIGVPADSALIITDKSTGFYLEENKSVVVTSSVGSKITYTVSYEEIN